MPKRSLFLLAAVLVSTIGCSSGSSGIKARLDEYSIELERTSAPAGEQTFDVRNGGDVAHQLIVLRTKRSAGDLPVKDGVVPTDAKGIDAVGQIELVGSGASQELTVNLRPGPYVLICNIAGHYTSGMHTPFRVT